MNRREWLTTAATGIAAAAGLEGVVLHALDVPPDPKSTLVVLKVDGLVSLHGKQNIIEAWDTVTRGTNWHGVKMLVLERDMTLEVHRKA